MQDHAESAAKIAQLEQALMVKDAELEQAKVCVGSLRVRNAGYHF